MRKKVKLIPKFKTLLKRVFSLCFITLQFCYIVAVFYKVAEYNQHIMICNMHVTILESKNLMFLKLQIYHRKKAPFTCNFRFSHFFKNFIFLTLFSQVYLNFTINWNLMLLNASRSIFFVHLKRCFPKLGVVKGKRTLDTSPSFYSCRLGWAYFCVIKS